MCISPHQLDLLRKIADAKPLIIGVGNVMRGDDAVGPAIVDRLHGRTQADCIKAGNAPENYLGTIIKASPGTILIIDAAHMGLETGQCRLLDNEEIAAVKFSNHALSAPGWLDYIRERTKARIYMLAIQPGNLEVGSQMSPEIKDTIDYVCRMLMSDDAPGK